MEFVTRFHVQFDQIPVPADADMRGYRLLEKEAEEVVKCVKYNTEEDVVRLLLKNNKESREICTIIVQDGTTALHAMAQQARPHIMKLLLDLGVDINARNNEGKTALQMALLYNNLAIAKMLIDGGAQVDEILSKKTGISLLHKLVMGDRLHAVQLLVECGATVNVQGTYQVVAPYTLLSYAQHRMMQYLLEKGGEINALDGNGESLLHVALKYRNLDMVKLLIQKGADVMCRNKKHLTPLHLAVEAGLVDITRLILKKSTTNVNTKEKVMGRTPLHFACAINSTTIARMLIDNGADVNLSTTFRKSPLHITAKHGSTEAAQLLIKHHANVNMLTTGNRTPLHEAIENKSFNIATLLVQAGTNINFRDLHGLTPLHYSVRIQSTSFVQYLLHHGAVVNTRDNRQKTALHHAAELDNYDICVVLINADIDLESPDEDNKTAEQYAQSNKLKHLLSKAVEEFKINKEKSKRQ